jgi:hypothetical protein
LMYTSRYSNCKLPTESRARANKTITAINWMSIFKNTIFW